MQGRHSTHLLLPRPFPCPVSFPSRYPNLTLRPQSSRKMKAWRVIRISRPRPRSQRVVRSHRNKESSRPRWISYSKRQWRLEVRKHSVARKESPRFVLPKRIRKLFHNVTPMASPVGCFPWRWRMSDRQISKLDPPLLHLTRTVWMRYALPAPRLSPLNRWRKLMRASEKQRPKHSRACC